MLISIIYAVTSTGCAAFSKSLCVPYMQVWCTQVLWFPSISGPLSVTELRSWLSKPAVFLFFFSRDRSSNLPDFSSILKRQENLHKNKLF